MNNTKKITMLAMGIALYVVLAATVKIPLIGHIQTDLGYVAFGAFCVLFGWIGAVVGVFGCLIESLLFSGWIPVGWMLGQVAIGVLCGICYKKTQNRVIRLLVTILAVFIGVAVIKTAIECALYSIPVQIKFTKNCVAFVADTIPMILGLVIGERLKPMLEVE